MINNYKLLLHSLNGNTERCVLKLHKYPHNPFIVLYMLYGMKQTGISMPSMSLGRHIHISDYIYISHVGCIQEQMVVIMEVLWQFQIYPILPYSIN